MTVTDRQKRDLEFIKLFSIENGYSPTVQEIADNAGNKSINASRQRVNSLIEKGLLTNQAYKSRTLQLTALGETVIGNFK